MKLVIDTREKDAFKFPENEVIVGTLKTGDYSIEGYENEIGIERKSVSDAIGSVFSGRERFEKEWQRGKDFKYFAIVIEGTQDMIATEIIKNYARNKDTYTRKINVKGQISSMINTYLHWSVKYNVPVFFCKNKYQAEKVTLSLLTAFNNYKRREEI